MNIIKSGNRYQVYGEEEVNVFENLPTGTYNVDFHKMMGFYLTSRNDLTITEEKIYGSSEYKVKKVMRSYNLTNRNFGVLLSGQKGIGKSLFVRLLACEAIKNNLPVVVVSTAIPGLADFISSIKQNCVVVFDEFEKTFSKKEDWNPQDDMLSLFDGLDGGHKLFVVTCNKLEGLNQYMLNRPGRFHYHFTMTAPTSEEVREYLTDKVLPEYQEVINDVVSLSGIIDMPYDYLRAIAFELNQGYSLKEAMGDLNITRAADMHFNIKVYLSNGLCFEAYNKCIDFSEHDNQYIYAQRWHENSDHFPNSIRVCFIPATAHMVGTEYIINDHVDFERFEDYDFEGLSEEEAKRVKKEINSQHIERVVLTKIPTLNPERFFA